MSLDQIHIGVLALTWLAGLIGMGFTVGKVSRVRRVTYVLAFPLWAFFCGLYVYAFFTYQPTDTFTPLSLIFRAALGGIALEGILVPYVDRLEANIKNTTELRIAVDK